MISILPEKMNVTDIILLKQLCIDQRQPRNHFHSNISKACKDAILTKNGDVIDLKFLK